MFDDHAVPKNQTPKKIIYFDFENFQKFFIFVQKSSDIFKMRVQKKSFFLPKKNFASKNRPNLKIMDL